MISRGLVRDNERQLHRKSATREASYPARCHPVLEDPVCQKRAGRTLSDLILRPRGTTSEDAARCNHEHSRQRQRKYDVFGAFPILNCPYWPVVRL